MNLISKLIIPIFVVGVILYGFVKRVDLYESFLAGAKEGLIMTFHIAPAMIAMIFATNLFLNSHFIDVAFRFLHPFFHTIFY